MHAVLRQHGIIETDSFPKPRKNRSNKVMKYKMRHSPRSSRLLWVDLSKALMSPPVLPQHPITFLSSRQLLKPADPLMEAAAKSPSSTCPTFPPDTASNTCPCLSPEPTGITHHSRFPPQGGEAAQGGERRSLLQGIFQEPQSVQILTSPAKV